MSNERRQARSRITPGIRFLLSVASVVLLLFLSGFAFRYCLSLFVVGDEYLIRLPGANPIAEKPLDSNANGGSDSVVQTGRATILAVGDLMPHLPVLRAGWNGQNYNFEYMFQYVKPYISAADYAVVNLETTFSGADGLKYTGSPKYNAPDAVATGAYATGFDMMLTGNNRCYDHGTAGLLRTLETIKSSGMDTLGTVSAVEESKYIVQQINGIRIGMINYTFAEIAEDRNHPTIDGTPVDSKAAGLVNVFDYDMLDVFYAEMEDHVSAMRASGAEAIVLFIHWGDKFSNKPSTAQQEIAQQMCDLGVDVIAGSHPNVVQSITQLTSTDGTNKTLCLYSMGNFLSNQRSDNVGVESGHTEDGLMFSFTFVKYSNGEVHVESTELIPTWVLIRGTGDDRTYYVLPLDVSVEDWNTVYSMNGDQAAAANKSLERTNGLIYTALKEVKATLQQQNEERSQLLGTITGGIG